MNERRMIEKLKLVKGERSEKRVYEALKRYFKKHNEEVLVLYSFKFIGEKEGVNCKQREKDFILINLSKRYIMPLEVKTSLGIKSLQSAIEQIENCKNLFNNWIGGDLSEKCGWRFVPSICFDVINQHVDKKFCLYCSKFILSGENIDEDMEKMLQCIPTSSTNYSVFHIISGNM